MANGNGPKIPRNLKPDLENINVLLQDISTKISSLHQMDDTFHLKIAVTGEDKFETLEKSLRDLNGTTKAAQKINAALVNNLATRNETEKRLLKAIDDSIDKILKRAKVEKDLSKEMVKSQDIAKKAETELKHYQNLVKQGQKLTKQQEDDVEKLRKEYVDETEALKKLNEEFKKNGKEMEEDKKLLDLQAKAVESLDGELVTIGKTLGNQVLGALDKFGTGLATLAIDAVFFSLEKLKGGFLSIYDLMERTQKAVGDFNLSMGATTTGLDAARTEAFKLDGTMRALTGGEIGVGLKMWQETSKALGFVGKGFDQVASSATLAGRAMGIGSDTAGELTRTFMAMGETSMKFGENIEDAARRSGIQLDGLSAKAKGIALDKFAETLKTETSQGLIDVSDAANKAGMSVADFGKEVSANKGFMAAFGKAGKKAFLDTAAYVKKLGLSLQTLDAFTQLTDTFQGSAEQAAKMNTVFGTSINALDQMLEQDPSKRLDKLKTALKAQGKEWGRMSRAEQDFFAKSNSMSREEAAAFMTSNLSKKKFDEQNAKAAKEKINQEEQIRKGLAATAETLMNWKQVMDQITMAFKPMFDPFLKAIGLMAEFEGEGKNKRRVNKTFAQNVAMMVGKVKEFFGLLEKNEGVRDLIKTIADDFKGLFGAFTGDGKESKKTMEDIVHAIGVGASAVERLYKLGKKVVETVFTEKNLGYAMSFFEFVAEHIEGILLGFAGLKLVLGGASVVSGLVSTISAIGGSGGLLAGIEVLTGTVLPALGTAFTTILAPAAALAAALGVGYLIGTAIEKVAENLTIGGKSVQDILLDTAMAWKDNLGLLFTDSWELIKSLIRAQIPGFMEDLIPDFLKKKGTKEIAQEKGMALTGEAGLEGILQKLKDSKGGEGLTEKQISSLGTRFADWRDSDIKKVLEEGGVKDISGTLEKMRKGAAIKYETGYQNPLAAGVKGIDLNKGDHALGWKGDQKSTPANQPAPSAIAKPTGPATQPAAQAVVKPMSPAATTAVTTTPVNTTQKKVEPPKTEKVSTSNGPVTLVAGDVYLDGNLVGRHLLRGSTTR